MRFCVLRRNSRWLPKMVEKRFLGKVASRLSIYSTGKKICQNRSISHHFQHKCAFAFWEQKSRVDSADTLWAKNFLEITLSRTVSEISVFAFYAEIQDGRHKWPESDFWEKLPVSSTDTLGVKNVVEIALSRTVSEILKIFHFQH